MWQLRMHCNLRQPDAVLVLIRVNYDTVPSLKSLNLLLASYRIFTAHTLPYAVTWSLTFDLWRVETLYQIWAQSSNPWWSYCDLNIWPYDLQHVSSFVALCCEIVCTNFKLSQAIRSWNATIFYANMSWHAMTLTLKVCGRSGVIWS